MNLRNFTGHRIGQHYGNSVLTLHNLGHDGHGNFGRCFGDQRQTDWAVQTSQRLVTQILFVTRKN